MKHCYVPLVVISRLLFLLEIKAGYQDIRLRGGQTENEGRVEVLMYSVWGTVCDDLWDLDDATVVCKELGYPGAESFLSHSHFGGATGPIRLSNVKCSGNEASLNDCRKITLGHHNCLHGEDAGVKCTPVASVYQDIRLTGGQSENEGRVEVLVYGEWGTVCDNLWDLDDATVACKELGYPGAESFLSHSHFGGGTGATWLGNVECSGNEASLNDCQKNRIGHHNCGHDKDAGVKCTPVASAPNIRPCSVKSTVQGYHQDIVNVTWQVSELENLNCNTGIEYFTIYVTSTTYKQSFKVDHPEARWFIIDSLEPGRYFTFEVTLSTITGESLSSGATDQSILLMPVLPRLPEAPFFLSISSGSVTIGWVEWNPTRDIGTPTVVAYIPYHKLSDSSEWINGSKILFHKDYKYTFQGLIPGKFYDFSVAAVRDGFGGEGKKSPLAKTKVTKAARGNPFDAFVVLFVVSALTFVFWNRRKIPKSSQTNQETSTADLLQTHDQETSTFDLVEESIKGEKQDSQKELR